MKYCVLLLLMLSVSFASCSGQISQLVPAVVGQDGGLVNITVSLAEGDGSTYVSVVPRTGTMTQESIEAAVRYAYTLAGTGQDCDVLVAFDSPAAEYVEGPSAGAALTVMTYALLENRSMRNDTIITGTIEPSGAVGPVGGLYEKARGAALRDAGYFITPLEGFYEALLLKNVESEYGITVLQVSDVGQVIGFMLENRSIEGQEMVAEKRSIPSLARQDTSGIENFVPVAGRMIELENETLHAMPGKNNETGGIMDFYENEVERQSALLGQGYLFSAANEAFLNYIDLSTISVILSGNPDLARKKGEVGICLSSVPRPAMTEANLEWVIGRDLRVAWARDKFNRTLIDEELLIAEEYAAYNELMYGQAWCDVAKELVNEAPGGGNRMNESAWKALAEAKLAGAAAAGPDENDLKIRLGIAQDSYLAGNYGAAIYDAVYVTTMQEASDEYSANPAGAAAELETLLEEEGTSLWGRIYRGQALFLESEGEDRSAYRIGRFAKALDEVAEEMRSAAATESAAPLEETARKEPDYLQVAAIAVGVGIIIFLFMDLIILKWRSDGSNRARTGKIAGVKQKKSRT